MTITVLGLGPMGQALARALLDTGHRVTVWNRTEARADALADRTVVGLSSDTPDRARGTAALVHTHGGRYLDGAIMTPTDTIGTPGAAILLAGPKQLADAHRTALESLGRITWVGDEHGRAAAFDMALLDLFWTSVAGFEHALMVARATESPRRSSCRTPGALSTSWRRSSPRSPRASARTATTTTSPRRCRRSRRRYAI
jgi:3-hydroxyisobutyrate dehydrogenase-like beta-hydroxyacid dehydrogenase